MAVSTSLQNGSSVIAWETSDAVSFELLDSNGVPAGSPVTAESGASVWTSVASLADGGFSIIWDSAVGVQPVAQDYNASGAAVGAVYTVSGAPATAPLASTSLELPSGNQNGSGPWTTLLPNDDTIVVTSQDNTGPGAPQLLIQQFDPAGHEVGSDYVDVKEGLPGLGQVQTNALTDGAYVVTFTDNQNFGGALYYDLFQADGTHVASATVAQAGFQLIPAHSTASLPDGGFVMSWVAAEFDTQNLASPAPYAVFAEEFRSDGSAATSPQMLGVFANSQTGYAAPEIDALANGKYTISWTSGGAQQSASFAEQGAPVSNYTNDAIFTPASAYTLPAGPHSVTLVGNMAQTVTGNDLGDTIVSNDYASTLIGGQGNDTLVAGHAATVMTGGGGANVFVFPVLPWNAGEITDFNVTQDKIDVSAILQAAGYTGSDPFGDGTLTLNSDGHGGSDLTYNPPGAGSNGVWPIAVVDIDNVAASSLNTSTDFITGTAASDSGGTSGSGGDTGSSGGTGSGSSGVTSGPHLTADNSPGQQLTATQPNATFDAGQNSVVMTEDGGNNIFCYTALPWNAGEITNFNPAQDTIDVSAILKAVAYSGTDPFGDGTLTLNPDGHGGTDLTYNPPGAGANGIWPTTVVDIDNVTAASLNTSTDFVTGSGASGSSGTGTGTGQTLIGQTLAANDTAGQSLTATTPNDTFIAGHNSVVMTGDGGANTYMFNALPWNAGEITNFNPAMDKIDVSGILQTAGYTGADPFGDGTLSLNPDGHGGTELVYHPPGAGSNGVWPTSIVDIDHVTSSQFQASDWLFHH